MLNVLFPIPYSIEVSKLRQQLDEAHLAWATEWKRQQLDFRLENIRFRHDLRWNKRIFSLQAARDGEIWFWRATRVFVSCGVLSI
ncbi:MAG: hypothetical protein ABI192_12295 [Bradyrhizobium sp.]